MTIKERQSTRLDVIGLDCADCALTLESAVAAMPGVGSCEVQFGTGQISVVHDQRSTNGQIRDQIHRMGYRVATPDSGPLIFDVAGMDCMDCAKTLEKAIRQVPGAGAARVNFASARLVIETPSKEAESRVIRDVGNRLGFKLTPSTQVQVSNKSGFIWGRRNLELIFAALLSACAFAISAFEGPRSQLIGLHLVATILAGYPVARAALISVRVRRADMNLLMTIAALGALLLRDWGEASTLMVLFGAGLALQAASIDRTRGAIRALLSVAPSSARVRRQTGYESVSIDLVAIGDEVDVQPGEHIPVDGVVMEGESTVNQSALTGESIPLVVQRESQVLAGSINGDSRLLIHATAPGNDSTVSRIISLVESAHASKAPAQTLVERFAAIYTPIVLAGAVAMGTIGLVTSGGNTDWIYRALVLLVVACPCALVISTPVAFVSALGRASRMGVLFKGGSAVEALATVRMVSFDKTGTITHGRPDVTSIFAATGIESDLVLATAAALEAGTGHPIGRGIERAAVSLAVPVASEITVVPGRGVRGDIAGVSASAGSISLFHDVPDSVRDEAELIDARGETAVVVSLGDKAIGVIGVADTIRPVSASVISRLSVLGIQSQLLTGDSLTVARRIGGDAGFTDIRSGLLPADKVDAVRESQILRPTAMIGDGVNDAPALAAAQVGIAMGAGGSAVAIEAADVALMSDDLTQLPRAIQLARSTRRIVLQNIVLALASKVAFVGLTATGHTSLWLAVVADVGASLLVTFNALRLLKVDLD